MGTYRYHRHSNLTSTPINPGTPGHQIACEFLGLPTDETSTLEVIEKAFHNHDWHFQFDGQGIVGLEPNDDQEINDLTELEPLASLLDGFVEWEVDGEILRTRFDGGSMRHSEASYYFPVDAYLSSELEAEIKQATDRLVALQAKQANEGHGKTRSD